MLSGAADVMNVAPAAGDRFGRQKSFDHQPYGDGPPGAAISRHGRARRAREPLPPASTSGGARSRSSCSFRSRPPSRCGSTTCQIVGRHTIMLRRYAPEGLAAPSAGLVYFHGGGLVAGGLETHDALCRTLAHERRVPRRRGRLPACAGAPVSRGGPPTRSSRRATCFATRARARARLRPYRGRRRFRRRHPGGDRRPGLWAPRPQGAGSALPRPRLRRGQRLAAPLRLRLPARCRDDCRGSRPLCAEPSARRPPHLPAARRTSRGAADDGSAHRRLRSARRRGQRLRAAPRRRRRRRPPPLPRGRSSTISTRSTRIVPAARAALTGIAADIAAALA